MRIARFYEQIGVNRSETMPKRGLSDPLGLPGDPRSHPRRDVGDSSSFEIRLPMGTVDLPPGIQAQPKGPWLRPGIDVAGFRFRKAAAD